jgi:hypothetical protein
MSFGRRRQAYRTSRYSGKIQAFAKGLEASGRRRQRPMAEIRIGGSGSSIRQLASSRQISEALAERPALGAASGGGIMTLRGLTAIVGWGIITPCSIVRYRKLQARTEGVRPYV